MTLVIISIILSSLFSQYNEYEEPGYYTSNFSTFNIINLRELLTVNNIEGGGYIGVFTDGTNVFVTPQDDSVGAFGDVIKIDFS